MKNKLNYERTQKNISKTFLDMLLTTNFDDITIKDICENDMVTRATFYNYYEDKYHLFACIIEEYKQKLFLKQLQNRQYDSPKALFMDIAKIFIEFLLKKKELMAQIIKHCNNESIYNLFLQEIELNISEILKQQMKKFQYKIPPIILAKFFAGGLIQAVSYILESNDYKPEDLLSYIDIIINEDIFS